jgi:spore coat polysaccharide biosynthesis protein SpsF
MTSSRLPGKALLDVAGQPAIEYLLQRLERAPSLHGIVIAISVEPTDDPIADYCKERGVPVHRGPLEDVASRFLAAGEEHGFDPFVRVTGDSVLHDPWIVERGLEIYGESDVDLVTNTFPRSFPVGQSVEIVRADAMRTAVAEMTHPADREHVTRFLYENPARFRIRNFTADEGTGVASVALDTPDDYALLQRVIESMDRPHWEYGWRDIADLWKSAA